ncbi:MAG TPA: plasmid stabilization protein [Patescibacteria group bacterium]
MTLYFTQSFRKKAAKFTKNNSQLSSRLKKQFALFQNNPYHLGLRLHKLKGKRSEQYAVWIEGNFRALAIKEGDVYTFFDLVTHDQY